MLLGLFPEHPHPVSKLSYAALQIFANNRDQKMLKTELPTCEQSPTEDETDKSSNPTEAELVMCHSLTWHFL